MKNKVRSWVIWAIAFVVMVVLSIALPFKRTGVFWLTYVFDLVALSLQIYVMTTAFAKEKTVRSKFYGFPVARIGLIYLAVQLVLGLALTVFFPHCPMWIPVVLYVVLLAAAAVGFIAADTMRDEIDRQDCKLKAQVDTMRRLQSKVNGMVPLCSDATRAEVGKLAEQFRYSDPVSGEALTEVEKELSVCVDELQAALVDQDQSVVRSLCAKTSAALAERNRLCKLNK